MQHASVYPKTDVVQNRNHLQFKEKGKTRVLRKEELGFEKKTQYI